MLCIKRCVLFTFLFIFLFTTKPAFAYKCSITGQNIPKPPQEYFGLFVDTYSIPNQADQRLNFFKQIKSLGINSIRLQLAWSAVERPKDVYDWSYHDPIFKDIETAGLEALPILIKVPIWAIPKTGPMAGKNIMQTQYYSNWEKFNSEAVKRYSKNIGSVAKVASNWEIWNEPELSYEGTPASMVEILNLSYSVIKKTDPKANVWAPSTSTRGMNSVFLQGTVISPEYFIQIVKNGKFDAINIHLYQELSSSVDLAKKTKDYLLRNGNSINRKAKLVVTETNEKPYPCDSFNSKSEEERATLVVDRYVCLYEAGVNHMYYFMALDLKGSKNDNDKCSNNTDTVNVGLFNPDFTPRKSYAAIKVMINGSNNNITNPTPSQGQNIEPTIEVGVNNRYAACDLCGYCPPNPPPQSWSSCQKCLYPDINPDPVAKETLKVDPNTNLPASPASGRQYTFLGCIKSGGDGFGNEGAAGGVVQTLLNTIFSVAGGIAFLYLIYGAFIISTSQSNPEKLNYGRRVIYGAIAGLIFTLGSVFIVKLIASGILKIPGFGE